MCGIWYLVSLVKNKHETHPRTLCLEQDVLRTTSAPESLRQCFRLAGGWEEHRGTVKEHWLVQGCKMFGDTLSSEQNLSTCHSSCHPDCPLCCHMLPTTGGKQANPGRRRGFPVHQFHCEKNSCAFSTLTWLLFFLEDWKQWLQHRSGALHRCSSSRCPQWLS